MHRHHALEEITEYVKGNDAAYAGLERCGPNRQATSKRDPNECHVLKVERIQHSSHRSMPIANERSSLLLKHDSLPRPLKRDDIPALVLKRRKNWKELLDVAVEAPEQDQRPIRFSRREVPCRQPKAIEDNVTAPLGETPAASQNKAISRLRSGSLRGSDVSMKNSAERK